MRLRTMALFSSALLSLGLTAPASASTGGTAAGDKHPNVALLVMYTPDGRFSCSGTLVSPKVVLTAAHCLEGVVGKTLVTFDAKIAEEAPSGLPSAAEPSRGYAKAELTDAGYGSGVAHVHPQYSYFEDLDNWNDVGVVVLDEAVSGVATASLAPMGRLNGVKLSKTLFTAVGYGTEMRRPESGPQKPMPMSYPLMRRFVDSAGQKLTPQILQTHANVNKNKGTGGTCFGDSGGPLLLEGKIVALTSYGNNDKCHSITGSQRVDIPVIRNWLATFGL